MPRLPRAGGLGTKSGPLRRPLVVLLVATGIAIGVPITLAGSRIVANLLYGLRGTDTASLLASVVALMLVSSMAGYLPARRAAQVDPMVALRYE